MPPRPPKPPFYPHRAFLVACAGVLLLTIVGTAFAVLHRRPAIQQLSDNTARALIGTSASFNAPLTLPLPTYVTVRDGSPDAEAYHALAAAGMVEQHMVSLRFYRHQRRAYRQLELQLTDRGWAAAPGWQQRDDQTYLVPLAQRSIESLGLSPGSDPATGTADYWIRWRWQPTELGTKLAPNLRDYLHISSGAFGAHATLSRSADQWQVTSVTIER